MEFPHEMKENTSKVENIFRFAEGREFLRFIRSEAEEIFTGEKNNLKKSKNTDVPGAMSLERKYRHFYNQSCLKLTVKFKLQFLHVSC